MKNGLAFIFTLLITHYWTSEYIYARYRPDLFIRNVTTYLSFIGYWLLIMWLFSGGEGQWDEGVTSQDDRCTMKTGAACWTTAAAILVSAILTGKLQGEVSLNYTSTSCFFSSDVVWPPSVGPSDILWRLRPFEWSFFIDCVSLPVRSWSS